MRGILVLLGLAVLVVAVLIAFGFINVDQTVAGRAPSISVQGGQAPKFDVNVGKVDVGMENRTVAVPRVNVEKPVNSQAPAQ